jgi:hypothetical protein
MQPQQQGMIHPVDVIMEQSLIPNSTALLIESMRMISHQININFIDNPNKPRSSNLLFLICTEQTVQRAIGNKMGAKCNLDDLFPGFSSTYIGHLVLVILRQNQNGGEFWNGFSDNRVQNVLVLYATPDWKIAATPADVDKINEIINQHGH